MTFAVACLQKCTYCLSLFGDLNISKNVRAGSFVCVQLDSAVVSPPGTAPTLNMS